MTTNETPEERWAAEIDRAAYDVSQHTHDFDLGYVIQLAVADREVADRELRRRPVVARDLAGALARLAACGVLAGEAAEASAEITLYDRPGETRYARLVAGGVGAADTQSVGRWWEFTDLASLWDLNGRLLQQMIETGMTAGTDPDSMEGLGMVAWEVAEATIVFANAMGLEPHAFQHP